MTPQKVFASKVWKAAPSTSGGANDAKLEETFLMAKKFLYVNGSHYAVHRPFFRVKIEKCTGT